MMNLYKNNNIQVFSIHKTMRTLCVYYYYIVAKSKVEYAKQFISKLLMLL